MSKLAMILTAVFVLGLAMITPQVTFAQCGGDLAVQNCNGGDGASTTDGTDANGADSFSGPGGNGSIAGDGGNGSDGDPGTAINATVSTSTSDITQTSNGGRGSNGGHGGDAVGGSGGVNGGNGGTAGDGGYGGNGAMGGDINTTVDAAITNDVSLTSNGGNGGQGGAGGEAGGGPGGDGDGGNGGAGGDSGASGDGGDGGNITATLNADITNDVSLTSNGGKGGAAYFGGDASGGRGDSNYAGGPGGDGGDGGTGGDGGDSGDGGDGGTIVLNINAIVGGDVTLMAQAGSRGSLLPPGGGSGLSGDPGYGIPKGDAGSNGTNGANGSTGSNGTNGDITVNLNDGAGVGGTIDASGSGGTDTLNFNMAVSVTQADKDLIDTALAGNPPGGTVNIGGNVFTWTGFTVIGNNIVFTIIIPATGEVGTITVQGPPSNDDSNAPDACEVLGLMKVFKNGTQIQVYSGFWIISPDGFLVAVFDQSEAVNGATFSLNDPNTPNWSVKINGTLIEVYDENGNLVVAGCSV